MNDLKQREAKKALDYPRASIMAINKKLIAWENSFAILLVSETMSYDIVLKQSPAILISALVFGIPFIKK